MKTLHEYRATTIDGNEFNFSELKGKKVMIVNTASKCGLTPQYVQLEQLYKKYGAEKFVIIGFPANDFLGQEPASNEEIAAFCQKNYGVSFQMMEKISVKGKAIHPIYQWLTLKEQNGVQDASVTWNFQKFLIDENGNWVKSVSPKESPDSEEVLNWLNN
ncbi:MAG TPA: glutathione peroxidase [Bacteroidia bacterium]|nr:glutathione peroxidase [Bacteroidia bacterium]